MSSPANATLPRVIAPSSTARSPEMAFTVVDLPAPLAPSSAVMPPCLASRLNPRSTRMTSLNTTSTFLTSRIAVAAATFVVVASILVALRHYAPGPTGVPAQFRISRTLLAQPAVLAVELRLGDLLDLDLAVLEVTAVDRHGHRAAMIGRGPGRQQADALEAFRHPVLLGVHAFADVLAGNAAVCLGPLH